jgi:hypothetical protein
LLKNEKLDDMHVMIKFESLFSFHEIFFHELNLDGVQMNAFGGIESSG